jgi:hypothetical protein
MRGDRSVWPDWPGQARDAPGRVTTDERGLPTDAELFRLAREGWTHAEIRAECERVSGLRWANSTVSAALSRGAANAGVHALLDTVPWRVQPAHSMEYPVRMLRVLGRRRAGIPLDDQSTERLDTWLDVLARERVVVVYSPVSDPGFWYADEEVRGGLHPDVPLRVQVVRWLEELPVREIDDGRPDEPPRRS